MEITEWGEVRTPEKFNTTISWTRILHRTYLIINSSLPIQVLATWHVMSFNVMTYENDYNLIPSVVMLGSSKMFIAIDCNFSCNLKRKFEGAISTVTTSN